MKQVTPEKIPETVKAAFTKERTLKKPQKVFTFLSPALFDKKAEFERDPHDMPTRKILVAPENSKQELIFIVRVVMQKPLQHFH